MAARTPAAPVSPVDALTPTQARVYRLLETRPGLTIIEAARLLGCTHATATYHLNLLLQRGLIECQRDGREMRHFMLGQTRQPDLYLQALCRDPRREAVVRFLASMTAPLTLNELAGRLGQPFGFVKRTLAQLQGEGLVRVERQRFRYVVQPGLLPAGLPTLAAAAAASAPQPALVPTVPAAPAQ